MNKYITEYLTEMAETLSPTTVNGHRSTLNNFETTATEPVEVTVREVIAFREIGYNTKTAGTVNTMLKRVKGFFDWCIEKGYIDVSPASSVKLLIEGELLPKWLDENQEDLLIKAVNRKYLGVNAKKKSYREKAIIYFMLKAGLRVGEVVGLRWDEVQITGNKGKMLIRGKNQQQRTVPIIPDLIEIINLYKKNHPVKGEYVFYSQRSDSLTVRAVQKIITELKSVSQKEVSLDELTPHVLRHTFAHNLAKEGMATESIARLLGHMKDNGEPNIQQTIRYTKASENEIGDEMERILGLT